MKLNRYWKAYRKHQRAHLVAKGIPLGRARALAEFIAQCRAECAEVFGIEAARHAEFVGCQAADGSRTVQLAVDPTKVPENRRDLVSSYVFEGVSTVRH